VVLDALVSKNGNNAMVEKTVRMEATKEDAVRIFQFLSVTYLNGFLPYKVTLLPNIKLQQTTLKISPHEVSYHPEGFVTFNEKGEIGKMCTENLNKTLSENKTEEVLRTVAVSMCKALRYQ